jgi:hypothetical protein
LVEGLATKKYPEKTLVKKPDNFKYSPLTFMLKKPGYFYFLGRNKNIRIFENLSDFVQLDLDLDA